MIWFLEGQSSQRDIIAGVRAALPNSIRIFASHRHSRPEITGLADIAWQEPKDDDERLDWVISQAQKHAIKIVLAGRNGEVYEAQRATFAAAGLQLVTGALSLDTFKRVDDKSIFTREALAAGLACIPAITVASMDELLEAYQRLSVDGPVCVKPTRGIYGQGFWRLDDEVDPFRCFANADARQVNAAVFASAYGQSESPKPLLVMPYMPGSECSVDMVCEAGKAVAYVGRRKLGLIQTFAREGAAIELAIRAAEHFGCDGIINVQTRDDAQGNPQLLEINLRYSGGIGYTRETGVNLPGIFAARRLGLPEPLSPWRDKVSVKAVSVAIPVEVKELALQ
jgi:biotin carboxylase